jgi:6-phosphogluconolactonase
MTKVRFFDERRDIALPGNTEASIRFSAEHFITIGKRAINERGQFNVALSGGSTPKAIYKSFLENNFRNDIDWDRLFLFWSDERAAPPDHKDSNYKMAMDEAFATLPVPANHIFRMKAEQNIEAHALEYENIIKERFEAVFDLVMLGIGEDGHTASLFPYTHGLHSGPRLVVANFIPEMNTWRMTLTASCINQARNIAIYSLGKKKSSILKTVLYGDYLPDRYPVQQIGTPSNKALFIADDDAAIELDLTAAETKEK